MKSNLAHARLTELLNYDPETGIFSWKVDRQRVRKGDTSGYPDKAGYLQIGIDGRLYLAHRLAWFYVNGSWPKLEIDHINRDKADNRICNLRLATRRENILNKAPSKVNNSGVTGVYWNKSAGKWHAQIYSNGKRFSLGMFTQKESAIEARKQAEIIHFGACVA